MLFQHSAFLLYCFSVKKLPTEPVSSRIASASSLKRVNSVLCYVWFANRTHQNTEFTVMNDNLSHTSWKCKYHIVFAPKYRRKNIYGALKTDIGRILRQLCELKKVEIHEAEACPDHIHMLVSIPPNISVSQFMGYLKGKSSLMIFDRHANLKYKYGSRHFWCRGYYVNTAGADTRAIAAYIQNQLAEDQAYDQMTFTEYIDPFTGSKNTKA